MAVVVVEGMDREIKVTKKECSTSVGKRGFGGNLEGNSVCVCEDNTRVSLDEEGER